MTVYVDARAVVKSATLRSGARPPTANSRRDPCHLAREGGERTISTLECLWETQWMRNPI
jgi:hypothetical protein